MDGDLPKSRQNCLDFNHSCNQNNFYSIILKEKSEK